MAMKAPVQIATIGSPLSVGERIQIYRKRHHWKQKDLAKHAGISATHLSDIERGEHDPSLATRRRLAQALGIDLAVLLEDGAM